jgi:hypothetical protein
MITQAHIGHHPTMGVWALLLAHMKCFGDNYPSLLELDQNTTLQHIALNSNKLETPIKQINAKEKWTKNGYAT